MKLLRIPLLRQILGACAGAACALLLYEAYTVAEPPLLAWVQSKGLLPTASASQEDLVKNQQDERLDRIATQVRERLSR